jgi:hypothetical protein
MSSGRSPPQDAAKTIAGNTEPFYTNEDVAVLHDIVVLAQELLPALPERERLPTNALFNAYYDILPRVGVNADYDSRYARILFKIGGLRGDGTLYEKFEEILSRMGIEIEFDQEETGDVHSQNEHSQTSVDTGTTKDATLIVRRGMLEANTTMHITTKRGAIHFHLPGNHFCHPRTRDSKILISLRHSSKAKQFKRPMEIYRSMLDPG